MNMKLFAVLFLMFSMQAHAEFVYKCKIGNTTSIQSSSCPYGSQTIWIREYKAVPARQQIKQTTTTTLPTQRNTWYNTSQPGQKSACQAAQEYEINYRNSRGLKITFDELRMLGDRVAAACK